VHSYQNGVYWGAARFFEVRKRQATLATAQPADAKRKRAAEAVSSKSKKAKMDERITQAASVDLSDSLPIFDSVAEVKRKITKFLTETGCTKAAFLRALGGVQQNQLTSFMKMPAADKSSMISCQPGAGNKIYVLAYRFFEQLRLADKAPKTAARKKNEELCGPDGFGLRHDDGKRWFVKGQKW
jgi:hypothetical protein